MTVSPSAWTERIVVGRKGSDEEKRAPKGASARRCAILRRSVQRHGSLPDDRGPGGRFLAAVGRAGARVRGARRPGAVSLRPLPRARGRPSRTRRARRLDDARGARRRDHQPAPGDPRLARDLPPPVGAGEGRRDRRPRLGRPGGARSRRRLARARARGLRVPVPAHTRADGRPRGAAAGDPGSWSDGPFSFDGAHYTLRELDAQPKPAQRPHPPIIIGGNAGPRSAALAARYADEYNTVFATPAEVGERRAVVERACEEAGREPLPFSLMTGVAPRPRPRRAAGPRAAPERADRRRRGVVPGRAAVGVDRRDARGRRRADRRAGRRGRAPDHVPAPRPRRPRHGRADRARAARAALTR